MELPMWIQNTWQVAAFAADIKREILPRTLLGRALILYRTESGAVVALEDRCPHRFLPLSLGKLIGDDVQCGYHGLRFDARGGCVRVPSQGNIPKPAKVASFPVTEQYGFVWVWLGEASLAYRTPVPDFHWMTDPAWAAGSGYNHVAANFQLLNDNLLDLTHESYVHPETIGNSAVAEAPLSVSVVEDRTVRAHREMFDCEPPPFYRKASGFTSRIDRWQTTYFTPPGFHVIETGAVPAGMDRTAARLSGHARERRVLHLITPETSCSSHYFWAVARDYAIEDEELTRFITKEVGFVFSQDRAVLEAQQRAIGDGPNAGFVVMLRADAGAIQGRRLVAKVLQAEGHATTVPEPGPAG
jgi:phenylpropionate dioxygenase-like ring-hydroxylating dioxygenase large terminal subunit